MKKGGFDGDELLRKANAPEIKQKLRDLTAEAKQLGICGVPSYRTFRQTSNQDWEHVGGIIWGQDETNVVEDLVAGWNIEDTSALAEPRKTKVENQKKGSRL